MTAPDGPSSPETIRTPDAWRVGVDLECPRRDAVGDHLLGGSLNSAIDHLFAADLVTAHLYLSQLAVAAAAWDRDAAQMMLDRHIRHFLILGTSGFPLWSSHCTLASLHDAQARIVVIEHDPVTQHLHGLVDGGAAADRALVLHVPARRHHALRQLREVAALLACGAPVGILATGLLRPDGLPLAMILSLLTAAPPGSILALTSLTTTDQHPGHVAPIAARFADAGIPIVVDDPAAVDAALGPFRRLTPDAGEDGAAWASALPTGPTLRTAVLTGCATTTYRTSR
ncbi:SAM-dependent methyltransferase [Amycolatopsis sp. NPDC051061]|uniref:SAM-dependent methyltransferase n=1 Tax=Amycolatopsis sp. NPDC051061 TaxID=3155042 RepID=UPI003434C290